MLIANRIMAETLSLDHLNDLHEVFSDPLAMEYWDLPLPCSVADTAAWLKRSISLQNVWHRAWIVRLQFDRTAIGLINYFNRKPWHDCVEIGYVFKSSTWGNGYASEAIRQLLVVCFRDLQDNRVEALVRTDNKRSSRVLKALGFSFEGVLRDKVRKSAIYYDMAMYALIRSLFLPFAETDQAGQSMDEKSELTWRGDLRP